MKNNKLYVIPLLIALIIYVIFLLVYQGDKSMNMQQWLEFAGVELLIQLIYHLVFEKKC